MATEGTGPKSYLSSFPRELPKGYGIPLLLIGGLAALMMLGMIFLAHRAKEEARQAFYVQYNRQQLAIATQASETIEELFDKFRSSLHLASRLLRHIPIERRSTALINRELDKVFEGIVSDPMVEFVVFDKRGMAVGMSPVDMKTVGSDYSWRDYYKWARDRAKPGEVYLSPFMKLEGGKARGEKGLIMARALYDQEGFFTGVAALVINFNEMARRNVLSIRIGGSGSAWLIDNNHGTILVNPERSFLGPEDVGDVRGFRRIFSKTSDGKPGTALWEESDPEDIQKSQLKLLAHSPIRIGDRLWTIGVSTPAGEVETFIQSLIHRQSELAVAAIAVILFGAALALGLLLTWNRLLSSEVTATTGDLNQRTRDLEETRKSLEQTYSELLTAQKLAAVGNLALGLAHEIRNPLFSINMNMQMIRRKMRPEGAVGENFDIVEGEVQRLNRLLGDVMAFARPVQLRIERIDPSDLGRKTLALLGEKFSQAAIAIETHYPMPFDINCDPERVEQVLLNLFLNAVEALEKKDGQKKIVFTVRHAADGGGEVEFIVSDNGPGLKPEDMDKLFDPFFTTKAMGGGLGLAIAHAIALRHSGTIEASANVDGGATFTFRLPVAGPAEEE